MDKGQSAKPKNCYLESPQSYIFDWLEFTIFYDHNGILTQLIIEYYLNEIVKCLFRLTLEDFNSENRGRNGYNHLYSYKNVYIWTTEREDMGIHFEITGQGCRDLEELGLNFIDVIHRLNFNYRVKYSRIDLSIDDFTNDYYNVGKIRYYLENNLISSKLRSFYLTNSGSIENNHLAGQTIQFGNKASLLHITFYNKLLERENNNIIIDNSIKYWTRTELRFRDELAKKIIDLILNGKEINKIIKGVLKDKIRFLSRNDKSTRKERVKTASWWLKFLNKCDNIKLTNPKVYTTIEQKKKWLNKNVSKTQLMVYLSELETVTLLEKEQDYFLNQLLYGCHKITIKELREINDTRIKSCLLPLTIEDIENITRGIKDVILEHQKNDNKNERSIY